MFLSAAIIGRNFIFEILFFNLTKGNMPITREKKQEILKDLEKGLGESKISIFVNFHGLSVASLSELRKSLRASGARFLVSKKTLIKKALEKLGFSGQIPELEGEAALAFAQNDSIAAAKILNEFAKKNKTIKFLGGVFENEYIDSQTVVKLANIPPREVLLGQFVNIINSPRKGVVVALNGIMRNFISVLSQSASGGKK